MYPSFGLLKVIICFWLLLEGDLTKRKSIILASSDTIFVDIKPGKFQAKNVIKIESSDKRIKRDKTYANKPSVILEFTPGFFSHPILQDLYAAITGSRETNNQLNFSKVQILPLEDTKMILSVKPLKIEDVNLKRELNQPVKPISKDIHMFHLTIKPEVPKHVKPIRIFNNTCQDKTAEEQWCPPPDEVRKSDAIEPDISVKTTCYPTKPHPTKPRHMCKPNWKDHQSSDFPCLSPTSKPCETTKYTACRSSYPATVMPQWGDITTVPCRDHSTTYTSPTEKFTTLITQKCDKCKYHDEGEPEKYILLFKRSPFGSWSEKIRKKRQHPRRRNLFKFKLQPVKN